MSHNTIPSAQPPARRNQLDVLEDIAGGISELVDGGGGSGGPDKELISLSYSANKNFTGATQGDLITGSQVVDLSGATPVVGPTVWYNQSTRTELAGAPLAADVDLAGGGGGATNAQLIAALGTQTNSLNSTLGTEATLATVAKQTTLAAVSDRLGATNSSIALAPSADAPLNGLTRGFWRYGIGLWDEAPSAVPTDTASMLPTLKGLWRDMKAGGNVASGTADSGNPIKVGGKFNNTPPVLVDGDRGDLQIDQRGNLKMGIWSGVDQAVVSNMVGDDVSPGTMGLTTRSFGYMFDPAGNWDRVKGTAAGGLWIQGNAANEATMTANPIPFAGIYKSAAYSLSNGQQAVPRLTVSGDMRMTLVNGSDTVQIDNFGSDNVSAAGLGLRVQNFGYVYDSVGNNWDRMRGDISGLSVNVVKQPLVARKIQVTAVSAEVQLTAGVKRISMYARGCDMRFRITAATGTAIATTDHFIAAGERLEFEMPNATPWVQAIAADLQSATGQLEISEMS